MTDEIIAPDAPPAERDHHGRFTNGNSAGHGRPRGSRNRSSLILDQLVAGEVEAIGAQVVKAAKEGDLRAAELILARMWPKGTQAPSAFDMPPVKNPGDIPDAAVAVVEAVASGELTVAEAIAVTAMLRNAGNAMLARERLEVEQFKQARGFLEAAWPETSPQRPQD